MNSLWARIHRGYEHEICRERHRTGGPGNGDLVILVRFAVRMMKRVSVMTELYGFAFSIPDFKASVSLAAISVHALAEGWSEPEYQPVVSTK